MKNVTAPAQRRLTPEFVVIGVITAAYIVWLLSLPVFPSQDGPMHLFYANALGGLLSHSSVPYAHYFTLKYLPPPYSLYYYLLLLLEKAMPLVLADRIVICLTVGVFVFGFRYLAQAIGPSADRMTLLLTLLTINWSIVMGFLNFCLSLGMAFVGLGLWYRFRGSVRDWRRYAFVGLVLAMMLTHPIPLAMMLIIAGIDLVHRTFSLRRAGQQLAAERPDVLTLVISCLSPLYIKLFTTPHLLQQREPVTVTLLQRTTANILFYANERGLCPLVGKYAEVRLERVFLLAVLLIGLGFAVAQYAKNRRTGSWTRGNTWLILSVIGFVILPLVPHEINSSYFFADRLLLPVWIAPLLAASGWKPREGARAIQWNKALIVFALVANATALFALDKHIRPFARQISDVLHQPADPDIHAGALGLMLDDSAAEASGFGTTWSPLLFADAHVIRESNAIIGNPPWIYLPIMPFTDATTLPSHSLDPWLVDHARDLTEQLTKSPEFRDRVMGPVEFVLIRQIPMAGKPAIAQLLESQGTPGARWQCSHREPEWFWTCTHTPASQEHEVEK